MACIVNFTEEILSVSLEFLNNAQKINISPRWKYVSLKKNVLHANKICFNQKSKNKRYKNVSSRKINKTNWKYSLWQIIILLHEKYGTLFTLDVWPPFFFCPRGIFCPLESINILSPNLKAHQMLALVFSTKNWHIQITLCGCFITIQIPTQVYLPILKFWKLFPLFFRRLIFGKQFWNLDSWIFLFWTMKYYSIGTLVCIL